MKSIIVAVDKHMGIGAENDLLWQRDLPADLKHFKDMTMGHTIVMGRKTFDSIGRSLPGRQNIVVTRSDLSIDGVTVVNSLVDAYSAASHDVFIIGGGQIYEQALADVDFIYVTLVDEEFDNASVFFPHIDEEIWEQVSVESHKKDDKNKYDYAFIVYKRRT